MRAEVLWFGMILHGDVHKVWTDRRRRRLRGIIRDIASRSFLPLYAFQTPKCDPKKLKFIRQLGGVFHHTTFTDEGDRADMYLFRPLD